MSDKKQRDIELFIVDVFIASEKIREYTESINDGSTLRHSSIHWDATIRQLEVIGEALKTLLDDEEFQSYAPTYFRKVVNFRNAIAHGYFGIDEEEVWNVVREHLDVLLADLENILVSGRIDLGEAIESELDEYRVLEDHRLVSYLEKMQKKWNHD